MANQIKVEINQKEKIDESHLQQMHMHMHTTIDYGALIPMACLKSAHSRHFPS